MMNLLNLWLGKKNNILVNKGSIYIKNYFYSLINNFHILFIDCLHFFF